MARKLARAALLVVLALAALVAVSFAYLYTRKVPVSTASPSSNNSLLTSSLFKAGKVLFVGAHPDDIEFYCAGLVYMLRKSGVDVVFAVATRGGKGRSGKAKIRLESLRTKHQHDAAAILGGARVVFFDYPDKNLPLHVEELSEGLRKLIEAEKPDIVFSWDPDWIYNPHPDHVAAAQAADRAALETDSRRCFYGTRSPNLWIGYGEDVFNIKLKSLRAHRTETPWPYFLLAKRFLTKKSAAEGAKISARYAEVYRMPLQPQISPE